MKDLSVMKRLASQQWGEVNRQKKILDGVYWFGCSGHGGYVVDTDKFPKAEDFEVDVFIRYGSSKYRPSEQHFAIFEEDCDWAVIEYLYPEVFSKVCKIWDWDEDNRISLVEDSVERWNKEYLK
jgi:hypothetical protein